MGFKQDDDFLRFITMGAAGSAAVSRQLREEYGHRTIELERYAMANKIWATKIKRLRLADLVCLNCGRRIEARAKSDLRVRMSHSHTVGREWDAGLRDDDLCAFVPWTDGKVAGPPQYFTVGDMRQTVGYAKFGSPKAASEGAERDLTWPTRLATRNGVVENLNLHTGRVKMRPFEGRRQTVSLPVGVPTIIYVNEGDEVRGGGSFVMGCLDRPKELACPGETWRIESDLQDPEASTRYAAVKAIGARGDVGLEADLVDIANDDEEDDRIRLEAWASLSRLDPQRYTRSVVAHANERTSDDRHARALAMEAIFILSELGSNEAADALTTLAADQTLDSEGRCAAVWGLGVAGVSDPDRVLPFIADENHEVALHALAGIGAVSDHLLVRAAVMLGGTDIEAASAGVLLAKQGDEGARTLLQAASEDGRAGVWATAALGGIPEDQVRAVADGALGEDLERAVAPVWAEQQSWLRRQEMDTPLRFLERQTIRHLA
jgi:HEAT repeat protein